MTASQGQLQPSRHTHVQGIRISAALEQHANNSTCESLPHRQMQRCQIDLIPRPSGRHHARKARTRPQHVPTAAPNGNTVDTSSSLSRTAVASTACSRWMRMPSTFRLRDARSDCVSPRLLCAETSAPCSRSMSASSVCPLREAKCHGVDLSSSGTCTLSTQPIVERNNLTLNAGVDKGAETSQHGRALTEPPLSVTIPKGDRYST